MSPTTTLMAMGGAVDTKDECLLLREFCSRAGGADAHLLVVPTASHLSDTGTVVSDIFRSLGVKTTIEVLDIFQRPQTRQAEYVSMIERATGIFFTGGNQMRLSVSLVDTPVGEALLAAFRRGTIIAGTSAGTAILSAVMIAYGDDGPTPRHGMAQFLTGLGFNKQVVFDQHFRQRDRLGRLLYAIAAHPGVVGVGVDENTAAIIEGDLLTVMGENAVTIVDGDELQQNSVAELDGRRVVAFSNARLHVLIAGSTYHLTRREATIPKILLDD